MKDTLSRFVEECEFVGMTNHEVYKEYIDFCKTEGIKEMEFKPFMLTLCKKHPYTTKQKCTMGGMIRIVIPKIETLEDRGLEEYLSERPLDGFEGVPTNEAYNHYVKVCRNEEYPTLSSIEFSRRMCTKLNMITKTKHTSTGYIRVFTYR